MFLDLCCEHNEIMLGIKWLRMWHDLGLAAAKDLWDKYKAESDRRRKENTKWRLV
jgi:hypothetical protein